jgi:zinc protease
VNGTTDVDRTNYFATVPSGNLEKLLWVESDRLATLLDGMDLAKLDNQRDVVKNERRQSYENQPYGRWVELLVTELYPYGHPYSWPTIGSMADLTAATLDDVKEFFRTYYTPNNSSSPATSTRRRRNGWSTSTSARFRPVRRSRVRGSTRS